MASNPPTGTRSIEEIYRDWRLRIVEAVRNRDSIADATEDAERHGTNPSDNLEAYKELREASYDANNAIFGFSRECQLAGFENYSVSTEGKIAYSRWAPSLQASILIMRAQNLIDHSSSASSPSSSSFSSQPARPLALSYSGANNPFAAAQRTRSWDQDDFDSHLRSHRLQSLPSACSSESSIACHASQPTPSRIVYPSDPSYNQLKNHHLYQRNRQDGTLHLKPREEWEEATRKRDQEAERRRRRS